MERTTNCFWVGCSRLFVCAVAFAAWAGLCTSPAHAQPLNFDAIWTGAAGDGVWQTAGNWSGGGVPGDGDRASIPTEGGAGLVRLVGNAVATPIAGLMVGGSADTPVTLDLNSYRLSVFNNGDAITRIAEGGTIHVPRYMQGSAGIGLHVDDLVIESGGQLSVAQSGNVTVLDTVVVEPGGMISGAGVINATNSAVFFNQGTIAVVPDPASTASSALLWITGNNTGRLDLDGLLEGPDDPRGMLLADADIGEGPSPVELRISGVLRDAFSGVALIGAMDTLRFDRSWQLDGQIVLDAHTARSTGVSTPVPLPAVLAGPNLTILVGGRLDVRPHTDGQLVTGIFVAEGGTFALADGASAVLAEDAIVDFNGTLDLGHDFRYLTIGSGHKLDVRRGGSPVDLDGSAERGEVRLEQGSTLRLARGLTDPFDGTMVLGNGSHLELDMLDGPNEFSSAATFEMSRPGLRWSVGGVVTINADLDFDGDRQGRPDRTESMLLRLTDREAHLRLTGDLDPDSVGQAHDIFAGTILIEGGTLEIARGRPWQLADDARLDLRSIFGSTRLVGDALHNYGEVAGRGEIVAPLHNFGTLDPGVRTTIRGGESVTPGSLLFQNDGTAAVMLTLDDAGTLRMDIAGPVGSGSGFDQIRTPSAHLGGTLDLSLIGTFVPQFDDAPIPLLEITDVARVGTFRSILGANDVPGELEAALAVTYGANAVWVQLALIGDANFSGSVEQGDLDAVLSHWGMSDVGGWAFGDLMQDGVVDQGDLDAVLNNWGSSVAPDFRGVAVPEPTTAMVLVSASTCLIRRRSVVN